MSTTCRSPGRHPITARAPDRRRAPATRPATRPTTRGSHDGRENNPRPKDAAMTPVARVQSAIELLTEIARASAAADDVVGGYFRKHRFIGSKDRAAISEHIYAVLRRRGELDWWIGREGEGLPLDARTRLLPALLLGGGWGPGAGRRACDRDPVRPPPRNDPDGP